MFNSTNPKSLPKPGACLAQAILPEYFQRNDLLVPLADGTLVKTCHMNALGWKFDFRRAFDNDEDWNYVHFRQLSYTDLEGNTQIIDVKPRNPHAIVKRHNEITRCGYVTKINGQRWGVTLVLNWTTGTAQILSDLGSPITGCLFQLIE